MHQSRGRHHTYGVCFLGRGSRGRHHAYGICFVLYRVLVDDDDDDDGVSTQEGGRCARRASCVVRVMGGVVVVVAVRCARTTTVGASSVSSAFVPRVDARRVCRRHHRHRHRRHRSLSLSPSRDDGRRRWVAMTTTTHTGSCGDVRRRGGGLSIDANGEDAGAEARGRAGAGAVMWFRRDLRARDNRALDAAAATARRHGGVVTCVFAWDEALEGGFELLGVRGGAEAAASWGIGRASRVWLGRALEALDADVRARYGGGGVQFARAIKNEKNEKKKKKKNEDSGVRGATNYGGGGGGGVDDDDADGCLDVSSYAEALIAAATAARASTVFASARYEPALVRTDALVAQALARANIELVLLPGHVLFEPSRVRLDMASEKYFFGTLMPYVHAAEKSGGKPGKPIPAPAEARIVDIDKDIIDDDNLSSSSSSSYAWCTLDELKLTPRSDIRANWSAGIREEWDMSEAGALEAWDNFKRATLEKFEDQHGRADLSPTSRLSPYLRFGQISPRTMYYDLSTSVGGAVEGRRLSRLFWHRLYRREFAYWQLHHWPELATTSVRSHYERRLDWSGGGDEADDKDEDIDAAEALRRWQTGTTGFPTVDAGMRRLWATGWMHQTERMIAATFLVDYCGVHWTHGARWFHDTLVDADLGINAMMWQNAGKSGLDQWDVFAGALVPDGSSRAHDPAGETIARWIPELAALPPGHLRHRPWEASAKVLNAAGVELGVTYPQRMIQDPERARLRMVRGVREVREAEVRKAAEAAAANADDDNEDANARARVDVLVDMRTGNDFVLMPPGATKEHTGALLPVSTRKEFKKDLKAASGIRAAMMSAQAWAEKALNIGVTGAGKNGDASADETGFARAGEIGKKRAVRAAKVGETHSHSHGGHSHSHGAGGGDHDHSHSHGKKQTTSKRSGKPAGKSAVEHRSSSWARTSSKRAARGVRAAEAERKAVKSGRREAKSLALRTSGMRLEDFISSDDDDDIEDGDTYLY